MAVLTHCWPDVKAYSGKLRQNLRFVPGADIPSTIDSYVQYAII